MKTCHWLMPNAESRGSLQETIDGLAREHGAPVFVPHVTLFAYEGDRYDPEQLRAALVGRAAIALQPVRVTEADWFTKCVFLEFADSAALADLAKAVRLDVQSDYQFHAHLSLIYADLDCESRQAIARSVVLPGPIVCDEVWTMVTEYPITSRTQVEGWQVIRKERLGER